MRERVKWPGRRTWLAGAATLGLVWFARAQDSPPISDAPAASIERGRYLVHEVARCVQCHTPRGADGTLDTDHLLEGAPIPVDAPEGWRRWAFESPGIAGLQSFERETVIYLLQHGRRPSGYRPRPPMQSYHLNEQDATDIVNYLMSLPAE